MSLKGRLSKFSEEGMRKEIEQQIKNSGTEDENQIIERYKVSLRRVGTPEEEIEIITRNAETIQNAKHNISLDNMNIQEEEIEEIARWIVAEKPLTRQISLSRNSIGDKGAITLAHFFEGLNNLSFLNLQSNQIGKKGFFALYELKAQKPKLNLALGGNKINDAGVLSDIQSQAERKVKAMKAAK